MWKSFCYWLLVKRLHWTIEADQPHPDKFIICVAPHTSNWDFVIGKLYAGATGLDCKFLMKKEMFVWPASIFFRKVGGIPVWRSKHTSLTDTLAATARQEKTFHLCITPEGTRSLNPDWKKGFYYIALKADLPILLYGIDFSKKLIRCTKTIVPDGNVDEQMREIKLYYKDFKGKIPEKFTTGEI